MAPLTHTFDIRFARTAGFAAWLEAPANRFRWKGAGRLSISSDGITIASRRGISSLFRLAPSRRIPAGDLKEVYREGAALRFEFATAESAREVVPLWVKDRETAANIVHLLPTTRTVELEESHSRAAPRARIDRRVAVALLAGIAIGGVATWALMRNEPAPIAIGSQLARVADGVAVPVEVDGAAPSMPIPFPEPRPVPRDSAAYKSAARAVSAFNAEASELLKAYQLNRMDLESETMTREQFAESLPALERRWWKLTLQVLDADELAVPQFAEVRASTLEVGAHWRKFLALYAEGMRKDDPALIRRAFSTLALAEREQPRLWQFVP
ncbi:MAG: hypothetical protein H7Y89_07430 [Steroidobacteraceae bacterium]|nr:hypothetical protein [Steroidobacteraceae bacterium]